MLARELVEPAPRLVPAPVLDPLAQPVGGGDLELELGDHAEHPDGDLRCVQPVRLVLADLDDLAARRDEPQAAHSRREAPEPQARSVRRRRDRAGDLLGDDVALVDEREPRRPERLAELADRRRRSDHDAAALGVDRTDTPEAAQVEQQAVGRDDRRERVAGARGANRQSPLCGGGDRGGHLVLARRGNELRRAAALVAHPVRPRRHDAHPLRFCAAAQVTIASLAACHSRSRSSPIRRARSRSPPSRFAGAFAGTTATSSSGEPG